jgi:hypothetical protein
MCAELEAEAQRIIAEYDRREREIPSDYYALYHPHNLFGRQEHQRVLLRCLRWTRARSRVSISWSLARAVDQLKILNTFHIGLLRRHS